MKSTTQQTRVMIIRFFTIQYTPRHMKLDIYLSAHLHHSSEQTKTLRW